MCHSVKPAGFLFFGLRHVAPANQWCRGIYYKSAPGEKIVNKLCSWKKEAGLRTVLSAFMEFTNAFVSGVQDLSWMFITHFIVAMSSGFGKCAHFTCVVDWKCDCRCWAVASSCPRSEKGEADMAVKKMLALCATAVEQVLSPHCSIRVQQLDILRHNFSALCDLSFSNIH